MTSASVRAAVGTLYSLQPPLCVVEVNQHAIVERGIDAVCLHPRGRRELLGVLTEAIRPHDQPKVLHALDQRRDACLIIPSAHADTCPNRRRRSERWEEAHQQAGVEEHAQEVVHLAELDGSPEAP